MLAANVVGYFARRSGARTREVFTSLPDRLMNIGAGGYIEQPLIGRRILPDGFRLTFDRQNHRSFVPLELLHELAGIAPECG